MIIHGYLNPLWTLMVLFSCVFSINSLAAKTLHQPEYKQAECQTEGCKKQAQNILFSMDKNVNPCDDFYEYSCGGYNSKTKIPADQTSFSPFVTLSTNLQYALKDAFENIEDRNYKPFELVANSYKACMDEASINKLNGKPLWDMLKEELGGWPVLIGKQWNKANFNTITKMADLRHYNGNYLLTIEAGPNWLNNSENIIAIDQPSLGMVRDFLVNEPYNKQRDAYKTLMIDVAELINGKKLTTSQINEISETLAFEIELASKTVPDVDRRDIVKRYTKMTIKKAQKIVGKEISLKTLFDRFLKGFSKVRCSDNMILGGSFKFYPDLINLLKKTSKRTIANYLGWRLSLDYLPYLSSVFNQAKLKFDNVLQGETVKKERWLVCVDNVNNNLAYATGKLYVDGNFNEEAKKNILDISLDLKKTFKEMLDEVDWMDAQTKETALFKLQNTGIKVGYPDYYNDPAELVKEYEGLSASPTDHFQNNLNYFKFSVIKKVKEFPHPVNKNKWPSGPAIINAFHEFAGNNLILLAGILHNPVFDADRPRSLNYGAIGMVSGHEFSHGFDDTGKAFDSFGNLHDWWSETASQHFVEKTKCIVDQYENYFMPEINLTINGRNTLGENIADNAGLKVAYRAFKKSQTELGDEPLLPGLPFNHDQLFFLSFGTVWCDVSRVEALRVKVLSDVHSPAKYRVNGVLANLPEFLDAFNCPKDSKMASKNVCKVW